MSATTDKAEKAPEETPNASVEETLLSSDGKATSGSTLKARALSCIKITLTVLAMVYFGGTGGFGIAGVIWLTLNKDFGNYTAYVYIAEDTSTMSSRSDIRWLYYFAMCALIQGGVAGIITTVYAIRLEKKVLTVLRQLAEQSFKDNKANPDKDKNGNGQQNENGNDEHLEPKKKYKDAEG